MTETTYYRAPDGNAFRIRIEQDTDAESPRGDTNVTVMQTWERSYSSPDGDANLRLPFTPECVGDCRGTHDESVDLRRLRRWVNLFGKAASVLAVAGLRRNSYNGTLSVDDYSDDDSDYGVIGVIAVTADSWKECMGDEPTTPELLAKVLEQDVAAYNRWAEGEYVGYIVERRLSWTRQEGDDSPVQTMTTWEDVNSSWGFDDDAYALEEAKAYLPDGSEELDVIDESDLDDDEI